MNAKTLTFAAAALVLAVAMPASAYHIVPCPAAGCAAGDQDATEWGAQVGANFPVDDPTLTLCPIIGPLLASIGETNPPGGNGPLAPVAALLCGDDYSCVLCFHASETIVGFVACEDSNTPSQSGAGGLCFMSPGYDASTSGSCPFIGSNAAGRWGDSNGNAPDYNGGSCQDPANSLSQISSPAHDWYKFRMQNVADNVGAADISFGAQLLNSCTTSTGALANSLEYAVDMQYAYTANGGHVSGFPEPGSFPAPGTFGGYTVDTTTTTGMTACDGPEPFYYL